jgi:hypothetical protein
VDGVYQRLQRHRGDFRRVSYLPKFGFCKWCMLTCLLLTRHLNEGGAYKRADSDNKLTPSYSLAYHTQIQMTVAQLQKISPLLCVPTIYSGTIPQQPAGACISKLYPKANKYIKKKNGVFWDVTPCGSCKNRRFGGTWRLHHQGDKTR